MDYQIKNGVLINATGSEEEITIPDNVEKVGMNSFKKNAVLRKVVFPPNVKQIDSRAFAECKNLAEIDIQGMNVVLDWGCFSKCRNLERVRIYGNIKQIGHSCFEECKKLLSFSIPNGLEDISDRAFYECKQLETLNIPEGTKDIGEWAFYGCERLKSVYLPSTLKAIGEKAFNQTGLEEVHIKDLSTWCKVNFKYPENENTNLMFGKGKKLFLNGELITDVVIPKGIEEIKRGPFSGFRHIRTMNITEGVTTIKKCAFTSMGNQFDRIHFPASLRIIECNAMSGCVVKEIHIADIRTWCEMEKGDLAFYCSPKYYYNDKLLTELIIPQGTKRVSRGLFARIDTITSVRFPEGLETIENNAFSDCSNLRTLYFPSTLQHVQEKAFYNCTSLKEVHIPSRKAWSLIAFGPNTSLWNGDDGNPLNNGAQLIVDDVSQEEEAVDFSTTVTIDREVALLSGQAEIEEIILSHNVKKIDDYAFQDCTKLKKITIPSSVTNIGRYPFRNCSALEEICIEDLASWLNTSVGDINTTLYNNKTKLFLNGELITELVIPKELRYFSMNFRGYSYLTKVVFQEGNMIVPARSFKECPNLDEVQLSKTVESVGDEAFCNCHHLEKMIILPGVKEIYSAAFAGTGLKEVTLPSSLLQVAKDAFADCCKLTTIRIESYLANVRQDDFHQEDNVFSGCHALKHIIFDERVTTIWEKMFANCFTAKNTNRVSVYHYRDELGLDDLFELDNDSYDISESISTERTSEKQNENETLLRKNDPLRYYSVPEHITEIRSAAFTGCDALEEVSIPGSSFVASNIFGEELQERIEKGFIIQIRGKAGYGLNDFIKTNKGYKNFYFTDMLCREIPEGERRNAVVRIAKWVALGKSISAEVYESYITYLKQSKSYWISKNALTDENYPVYLMMIKEKMINAVDTEKLIKLTNENKKHELQVLLMNYQNEISIRGDYDSLFDDTTSVKNSVSSNDELDWLVDSTGTLVVAFENATSTIKFPVALNGKRIIGIADGFTFNSSGRSATKKVKSIVLPEGYISIGEDAFKDCTGLQNISLPTSMERIGSGAFSGCEKLESLIVPDKLISIGENAFNKCYGLGKIYANSIDHWMRLQFENESANPLWNDAILYVNSEEVRNLVVPDGTTVLNKFLFAGYAALTNITIPEGMTSIGIGTFIDCIGLTKLSYPQSLCDIGERAFENCKGLEEIDIPEWIDTIGSNAFSFCTGLKYIRIKCKNTQIGRNGFSDCGIIELAELSSSNVNDPIFDNSIIRHLIIHDYTLGMGGLGSMGSIIYTDQTDRGTLGNNEKTNPRIRSISQLEEDSSTKEDDQTLKGLTFVAAGELEVFKEDADYYKKEYKYYRYKDWENTGDIIEGYRVVEKYPKREDLKAFVELRGGRVTSSMSDKTDYLICNNKSAKNEYIKEANRRIIPVLDEETFIKYTLNNRFHALKEEYAAMLDNKKEAIKNMLPEERELISYELKIKELELDLREVQKKKAILQAKIENLQYSVHDEGGSKR